MLKDYEMIEMIAPDLVATVTVRFKILQFIYWMAPVGRRTLATKLAMTERTLRTETDFLKNQGLLQATKSGMSLTEKGHQLYHDLENFMSQLSGTQGKEKHLAEYYKIDCCIILAGNSDLQPKIIESFGGIVSEALTTLLPEGRNIIAVMGGTTMATVAKNMNTIAKKQHQYIFVPARGGVGESMSIQANTISAVMAEKTGGTQRMLYVPERVSSATYKPLLKEPAVQEVLHLIEHADCVIHSIGDAVHMSERRNMDDNELAMLKEKRAVSESFGYFFDEKGNQVYKIPVIGLHLKELKNIPVVIAVASGKAKAKAIHAYMQNAPKQTWLLTDEGAADEILKGLPPL